MLAEQFDVVLFDLDGVVYLGNRVLPHALESLGRLRRMGKPVRFLTNDPRPTRAEVVERLTAMGVEAGVDEVVTSGWATGRYLRQQALPSAYVVGSAGLAREIRLVGIEVVEQDRPAVVVVGCDEHVSYRHIRRAAALIERGARFVATNADGSFPTPAGPVPATGAIVEAVRAATGRRPVTVGKPYPAMFLAALDGLAGHPKLAMVGDNPASDILGAHQLGLAGILVAAEPARFPSPRDSRAPDARIPDLAALFDPDRRARPWAKPAFAWPERVEAGVAAVVLTDERRVLLVKRADIGLWGLPSGRVEPGETVAEAVTREVREETGVRVEVRRLIGVYSEPASQVFAYPSGQVSQFVTACFRCEAVGGSPTPDGTETLDVAFFDVDALPPAFVSAHRRWLADALTGQAPAFVR